MIFLGSFFLIVSITSLIVDDFGLLTFGIGVLGLIIVIGSISKMADNRVVKHNSKRSPYICLNCGYILYLWKINKKTKCLICEHLHDSTSKNFIPLGVSITDYESMKKNKTDKEFLINLLGEDLYKELKDMEYARNKKICDDVRGNKKRREENVEIKRKENLTKQVNLTKNVPKCPICGSTNLEKISLGNKAGSVAAFGVFAVGHVSKTYKCKSCGSKF